MAHVLLVSDRCHIKWLETFLGMITSVHLVDDGYLICGASDAEYFVPGRSFFIKIQMPRLSDASVIKK